MVGRTIIFFKGIYDTLDVFTDSLIEAFLQMEYSVFVYDALHTKKSEEDLYALLSKGQEPCTVITFNNMGYNLTVPFSVSDKPRNLWEFYRIPYINILMDHPFHYDKPLRGAPSTAIVLCTDRNHVKYVRRFYKNIRQTDFLPHAGTELRCKHKPLSERGVDVLYAGALPAFMVSALIPDLKAITVPDAEKMTEDVLKELVMHPEKTTEQAIEEYVKAAGVDMEDNELHGLIVKMRFLDSYATSFFREQAVRILVENGIRVTVYGGGWNQCGWSENPYFHYGGLIPAREVLARMNDSKIVLNTMTWFKAGAHDRIFNGMLAKAAVVTDDSSYVRKEFTDEKELAMFCRDEIKTLPERIYDLFGHLNRAQEMADCGYENARNCHTWKERAEYIAECFFCV